MVTESEFIGSMPIDKKVVIKRIIDYRLSCKRYLNKFFDDEFITGVIRKVQMFHYSNPNKDLNGEYLSWAKRSIILAKVEDCMVEKGIEMKFLNRLVLYFQNIINAAENIGVVDVPTIDKIYPHTTEPTIFYLKDVVDGTYIYIKLDVFKPKVILRPSVDIIDKMH